VFSERVELVLQIENRGLRPPIPPGLCVVLSERVEPALRIENRGLRPPMPPGS